MIEDSIRILEETGYLKPGEISVRRVREVHEAVFEYGTIDVYHLELVDMERFEYGKLSAMCGEAAFQCVVKVIELAPVSYTHLDVFKRQESIYRDDCEDIRSGVREQRRGGCDAHQCLDAGDQHQQGNFRAEGYHDPGDHRRFDPGLWLCSFGYSGEAVPEDYQVY